MKRPSYIYLLLMACLCLISCSKDIKVSASLGEDSPLAACYAHIVIPSNIAPLNFFLPQIEDNSQALRISHQDTHLTVLAKEGAFIPAIKPWKELLFAAQEEDLEVEHCIREGDTWKAYNSFTIHVSAKAIDPYIAYRLIPPGYEKWNLLGLYERCLENFDERPIVDNHQLDRNCLNCHSFCMQDPSTMQFHVRAQHAGTVLLRDDVIEKLNTKTDKTISNLVYPYWHPSAQYIAYSVNDTHQFFHTNNINRIEVLDYQSDVVVYDIQKNQLLTTPQLFSPDALETFPTFSPDGKFLYYCSAPKTNIPDEFDKLHYNLCRIAFDASTGQFGTEVDTIYNATRQENSVTFPRISPDGKHLLFTLSAYGTFSIWHQDADLWMMNLQTGVCTPQEQANSNSVDSYHSWSSNSRWVVFSSRRGDGLHTRLYISYVDDQGQLSKPFLLPQQKGSYYQNQLNSFNVPEFIKGPVPVSRKKLVDTIRNTSPKQVKGFQ